MSNPFLTTPRKSLTKLERGRFYLARGGHCEKCTRKLRSGDVWHIDHIVSLENGGSNEWSNLQLLCPWCHKDKSRDDRKAAAKNREVAATYVVPRQFAAKGPPMPGSKRSPWKRKMNGTWERR